MDIDFISSAEAAKATAVVKPAYINRAVAINTAFLATFISICKVKDNNIAQAMQQA